MATRAEARVEVYRFHPAVVVAAVVLALLLQSSLPLYLPFVPLLPLVDLALLVVIYFGISRRNPSTGLLLGLVVGVLQDALSGPIGVFGMAKTVIGYAASSLSSRIDTDQHHARLLLVFVFHHFHQFIYALVQRLLLDQPADFVSLPVLEGALVNSLLSVLVFPLLDRFRQST
ncbi:MAG: rod shape-determining protein MreD [Acidobacteria bacterium]|nr:rod shape-determining protein MreD [Acidobacteriota bacterium]